MCSGLTGDEERKLFEKRCIAKVGRGQCKQPAVNDTYPQLCSHHRYIAANRFISVINEKETE